MARFNVSNIAPTANDIDAGASSPVVITFDETINPSTVNDTSIKIFGSQTGEIAGSFSVSGNRVTFTPTSAYKPGEQIEIVVTDTVRSVGGNTATAYTAKFTIAAATGPAELNASPNQPPRNGGSLGDESSNGLGLGDLDGDGDLDVFVANLSRRNQVLLNNGSGVFTAAATQPPNPTLNDRGMSLGDLDGDGDLDAFVTNAEQNQVLLNNGSGVFTAAATQPPRREDSSDVSLGDLDGDGDLDAFVVTTRGANQVLLNNGSGIFTAAATQPPGVGSSSDVSLGDLDGDGDLDAFVVYFGQANQVLLNNGSGVFTVAATQPPGTDNSSGVSLGDLDGDGDLDAFVANFTNQANQVLLNNGSGVFTAAATQPPGMARSTDVSLGDLDGDGDLDAFVTNSDQANQVLLNNGSGVFTVATTQPPGTARSNSVGLGDLDGDGDLDAFVTNSNDRVNQVLLNEDIIAPALTRIARETPSAETTNADSLTFRVTFSEDVQNVNAADFTVDGTTTATVSGVNAVSASIYEVTVSGGDLAGFDGTVGLNLAGAQNITDLVGNALPAGEPGTDETYTLDNSSAIVSISSTTADGTVGIDDTVNVTVTFSESVTLAGGNLTLTLNNGGSVTITPFANSTTASGTYTVVAGQDSVDLDVTGLTLAGGATLQDGLGNDVTLIVPLGASLADNNDIVVDTIAPDAPSIDGLSEDSGAADNITNDQRLVFSGSAEADSVVELFLNTSSIGTATATGGTWSFDYSGTTLTDGDYILTARATDTAGNTSDASADFEFTITTSFNVSSIAPTANDIDAGANSPVVITFDDNIDPATVNDTSIKIYGSQTGEIAGTLAVSGSQVTFTPITAYKPGEQIEVVVTDSVQSVVGNATTAYTAKFTIAAATGPAELIAHPTQPPGSSDSFDVSLGDLDGDGDLDAFVANNLRANQVLLNNGSGVFTAAATQPPSTSNDRGVSLGDLDGDGDLDAFVVRVIRANQVLLNDGSGIFTAAATQPPRSDRSQDVSLGDLDGDGDLDAFVANNDDQANQVLLNDGSGVFTEVATQPPGSDNSYSVSLGDLDGDGDLDAFVANFGQANQVLLNDGSGVFTAAAVQPPGTGNSIGVSLGDLDGDGDLDAFVTNFSNQANQVLLNNGSGVFTAAAIQPPGRGSSDDVSLGDLDGDGDLDAFVANFGQANQLLLNDGNGGFTSASTQPPGTRNSRAVGLGDLDGDGDLDAFVANDSRQVNQVLINGDRFAPTLTRIARETPSAETTNADSLTFRVTFNEDVQNVNAADFTVNGTTTATVSGVNAVSASVYEVTVSGGDLASFDGTVGLDLAPSQDIQDLAGNDLPAGDPGTDETYTLDNSSAIVSISSTTADGTVGIDDTVNVTVTFSEAVTLTGGNLTLTLDNGGSVTITPFANSTTASGTYTVVAGQDSVDLDVTNFTLAGGSTLQDELGNDVTLTIPPGASLADNNDIVVDATVPTLDSITRETPSDAATNADSLTFRVTFGEDVQNVDMNDFAVDGTTTATVSGVSQVSASIYEVTVSGGNLADFDGTVGLNLAGAQNITDLAGNALPAGEPTADEIYTLDNTQPGDIVVNEIFQNPSAVNDADGEWFELYNPTANDIDINGWTIADDGSDSHTIANGAPLIIAAGGYLILGRNADAGSNGGVAVDYEYSSYFLANDDDEIILTNTVGVEIDRVEYDGGPNFPNPNGASMSLLDPTLDNNVGANWVTSNTTYGDGDFGTPGAANVILPTVSLAANDTNAAESPVDTATFTVSRDDTDGALTVVLNLGGDATGSDYSFSSGTVMGNQLSLVIPDGQASVTVTVTAVDDGLVEANETLTVGLASDAAYVVDSTGNTRNITLVSDDTSPVVTSIMRVGDQRTNAASADYLVTFNRAVSGVDITDFALTVTGITGASVINATTTDDITYTVTVNTGTGDGTLRLDLSDNNSITDNDTNLLGGSGLNDGDFITGESYTIDKTAPANPVINNLTDDTAADDNITRDTTLVFAGTAEADSRVELFLDGNSIGIVTATGGTWSFDYTGTTLTNGDYVLTARATDTAGNTSDASTDFAFTIDTTAPDAPSIDSLSEDSGAADNLTNDQGLMFSGSAEAGSVVELFLDGNSIGTATATGGTWSFDYTGTTLTDGDYILTARATDTAGNTSDASANFAFTIDTTAPDAPSIDSLSEDSGAADNLTNDQGLEFSGSAEAGSVVELFLNTTSIGTVTATGGTWSFDYTSTDLTDGDYILTARATDTAGNTSDVSANFAFTVDTTAPDAPSINSLSEDSGAADNLTNDQGLVFSGTAEADSRVELFLNNSSIGTVTATGGTWSFDYTGTDLTDGDYILTARATDTAGNTSDASANFEFTVDTTAPDAPSINSLSEDSGAADNITNDQGLVFSGSAEAGSVVELFLDGNSIGTATATGGTWSFDYTGTELTDGDYILTARATDIAGNTSDASADFEFTIDTTAPDAPSIDSLSEDSGAADNLTNDQGLEFSGTAEAASIVELFLDGLSIGTTTTTVGGTWSFDYTGTDLIGGDYVLTARATDVAGNISDVSTNFEFTVDTTAPDAPAIANLSDDTAEIDNITGDTTLVFAGTAEADSTVELFLNGTSIGTAIATGGNWSFDHTGTTLADGDYTLTATATDVAGNVSPISAGFDFTIDATAPTVAEIVPSVETIQDANVGSDGFTLTVSFSEAMDTAVEPTLSFPTSEEDPSRVLTFTSGTWTDATTYVASYDVTDANENIPNIDVQVGDAQDIAGNGVTGPVQADRFSIGLISNVEFSDTRYTIGEDVGISDVVTLTRSGDLSGVTTVQVTLDGGTATGNGTDYIDTDFPLTVTFAATETTKTIALPILDDELVEGDETIVLSVVSVSNAAIAPQSTATITITDNDTAGFTLSKATATVGEEGSTDTFVITLDAAPLTPVEFAIRSDDTGEVTVAPTTVRLDASNWNTGVTVTLTGQDDTDVDGNQTTTVSVQAVAAQSDAAFAGLSAQSVQVTTTDKFTQFDDDFTGTEEQDVEFALAGDDTLRGLGGDDRLAGQLGNDNLLGGSGDDSLIGSSGTDTATGGSGNDRMLGGRGRDRLVGNAGNDYLVGGHGADILLGGAGADTLLGGVDNDRLLGGSGNDRMRGNLGNDLLNGGVGNDVMLGGDGNDTLNGQGGNDLIRGGAGRDVIRGGLGNDRLSGELGNDRITTGNGRDRITIRRGHGFDRVTDFQNGQDRIILGGLRFADLTISQQNRDVLIRSGSERLLLLQNTRVGQINAADFV